MMNKESYDLFDCCRRNDIEELIELLKKYNDLDLTANEGMYFRLAIKHNNIDMLNTLIKYYEETQLQGDLERLEYKLAKHQLRSIFEDARERLDVSSEIQKIMEPYVEADEGSDDDLEGFDIPNQWDDVQPPVEIEMDGFGKNSTASDYVVVGLMGNDNGGDHFPLAAEDGLGPHSPYVTSH